MKICPKTILSAIIVFLIILLVSAYLLFAWQRYQNGAAKEAIMLAQSLGSMLHPEHISKLSGGPDDINNTEYVLLKANLKQLSEVTGAVISFLDVTERKQKEEEIQYLNYHDDKFIILLPKTNRNMAEKILTRIREGFVSTRVDSIQCSIAIGTDTKIDSEQPLGVILANAENLMYQDKTLNRGPGLKNPEDKP